MRFLLITTTLATATAHWPLHAQDAVPASFDCAMRKAAYAYGKKLLPRMGAFEPLFYALNLNSDDCPGVLEGAKETAAPLPVPAGSIFVAPTGAARASGEPVGSAANPFDDIQAAADAAADRGVKSVVLRGGTYSCTIEPQQLRRVHAALRRVSLQVLPSGHDSAVRAPLGPAVRVAPGREGDGLWWHRAEEPGVEAA
jgi:hypothetical protein